MMSMRVFLGLALSFMVFSSHAERASWLSNMIGEQESSELKLVQAHNKKEKRFFSTHGFILFYGSLCPHCKQFAPILKGWVSRNHAEVLPLSLDNQPLTEFPKYAPATTEWINAAFGDHAINYPALFVVNPKTKTLYPVGFGSMTDAELSERMALLIPKINAYEIKGERS